MGACCSSIPDYPDSSWQVETAMREDRRSYQTRLLMVGPCNSGKTTILKQLDLLFGSDSVFALNEEIGHIRQNCIDTVMQICKIQNDTETVQSLQQLSVSNDADLPNLAHILSTKWNELDTKIKYQHRFYYGEQGYILLDNMQILLDSIDEIMSADFAPTVQQRLFSKNGSSDIKQLDFQMDGHRYMYNMTDIPFSSIKKMLVFIPDAKVLIFVAALTDYAIYDQEKEQYAMQRTLEIFDSLINASFMRDARDLETILFLNKSDLFKQCIEDGISMKTCFPELDDDFPEYANQKLPTTVPQYVRETSKNMERLMPLEITQLIQQYLTFPVHELNVCYEQSLEYISEQFAAKNQTEWKPIYTHITCATDSDLVEMVFRDVQNIIIRTSLKAAS